MLNGLTPPFTPSGRSALAPPPPWHYAGQIMSLGFDLNRGVAQSLLPENFGTATGHGTGHFCEWQATTDGSELLDPVYSQYCEFFALIEVERAGARVLFCPFIYVDQDISMVRGWMQGWPKKLGSVWLTRSYDLDHPAAARIAKGARFGASLAVKDRRLAEGRISLTGAPAEPIGFLAMPTFGSAASPTIIGAATSGPKRLVRANVPAKTHGPAHAATGELAFFDSPRDELSLLQPQRVTTASLSTFALTVDGAIEMPA
jgi:hypothetical protein